MSKLKTNRGAAKRFKKTGGGGIKHRASKRNHLNTKMSGKLIRALRAMRLVCKADIKSVKKMLCKP